MLIAMNSISSATQASTAPLSVGSQRSIQSAGGSGGAGTPFSALFSNAVGQVDQLETQAQTAVAGLMTGSGVDVHQAMIATQKASMAFELALAVRNKAVQAYQQVIGMQF